MGIAFTGFVAVGIIVCASLLIWFFVRVRVVSRQKAESQRAYEDAQRRPESHNPDMYGSDMPSPNTHPNAQMYYSLSHPAVPLARVDNSGGSRSQPVLPAVVVSTGGSGDATSFPTPYGVQSAPAPYGESISDVHGGYGEAEYLPCPPEHIQTQTVACAGVDRRAVGTQPAKEADRRKRPVKAESEAEKDVPQSTAVELRP